MRTLILILITVVLALSATAGDLDPPGPPEPTVNLAEPHIPIRSIPFTILEAGSYILVNDLVGGAPSGITIGSSHVTLDLNGFSVVGDGSTVNAYGISMGGLVTRTDITIQNGTIRNWGAGGVWIGRSVSGVRLHNLTVESNALEGIFLEEESVITGCVAINNGTAGSFGGIHANNAVVRDCLAFGNSGSGVFTYNGSVIGCNAMQNGEEGIHVASATVNTCAAVGNQGAGILARDGSTVTDCTATSNQGDGFAIEHFSTIRGCTARRNYDDGIDVDDNCLVVGNHSSDNSPVPGASAGIIVRGDNNCIDGNLVIGQATGINIIGSNNLVIRNRARGNTSANYQDSGSNTSMAQRLTGGTDFISTDPWANFSF